MTTIAAGPLMPLPFPQTDVTFPSHEQPFRFFPSGLAAGRDELTAAQSFAVQIGKPRPLTLPATLPGDKWISPSQLTNEHALKAVELLEKTLGTEAPEAARAAVRNAVKDIQSSIAYLNIQDAPIQLPKVNSHFNAAQTWLDIAQSHSTIMWAN